MTHATLRGIERLQRGSARVHTTQLLSACEGRAIDAGEVACGGSPTVDRIPTCPRCAVLRDEALEGRLPNREVTP